MNPRSKAPMVRKGEGDEAGGMQLATTDAEQIAAWWDEWPKASIGCRVPRGMVLLDLDPRHGGLEVWNALEAEYEAVPTRTHYSGRGDGGRHLWLTWPSEDRPMVNALRQWAERRALTNGNVFGIDVLHHGHRYTILPPSVHGDTGDPYHWGDALLEEGDLVAPCPEWLEQLLTRPLPAEPAKRAPLPRPAGAEVTPADWYTDAHRWSDVLEPRGWRHVGGGDPNGQGAKWAHPSATAAHSATLGPQGSHLFVYSPTPGLPVTETGEPQGLTRFAVYAHLEHHGDLQKASSTVRATMMPRQTRPPAGMPRQTRPPAGMPRQERQEPRSEPRTAQDSSTEVDSYEGGDEDPRRLPETFWAARDTLQQVHDAALARRASPEAVLGAVLARVTAWTHHAWHLPALVGGRSSLAVIVALAAPSGIGKSGAMRCAADLVVRPTGSPYVAGECTEAPAGSGEGMVAAFWGMREEVVGENKKGEPIKKNVPAQVRYNVLFRIDEVDMLSALAARSGQTTMSTLRQLWSGERLGASYSSEEKNRQVAEGRYRSSVVVAVQDDKSGPIFDDAAGGTPQRFLWAWAQPPASDTERPSWPGALKWQPPACLDASGAGSDFGIADEVVAEVFAAHDLRNDSALAGEELDPLDSHANLVRLKTAAALAVLERRATIDVEDWQLARVLMYRSDAVRRALLGRHERLAMDKAERARAVAVSKRSAERVAELSIEEEHAEQKTADAVVRLVERLQEQGPMTWENLRGAVSSAWRIPAREMAEAEGLIVKRDGMYHLS